MAPMHRLTVLNASLQVNTVDDSQPEQPQPHAESALAPVDERLRLSFRLWPANKTHQSKVGTVKTNCGSYGFIDQEGGLGQVFVLPHQCSGQIPPVGAHVCFDIGTERQHGKPVAVNVIFPRDAATGEAESRFVKQGSNDSGLPMPENQYLGTVSKNKGRYGFVEQDGGAAQIFMLPDQCGGEIPSVGTRVRFYIGTDPLNGKPLAVNVTLDSTRVKCLAQQPGLSLADGAGAAELEEITCRLLAQLRTLDDTIPH